MAAQKQERERDYLVIGLLIAMMAMMVAGFFSLDNKINVRIDALTARMDALAARMDAMEATLSARIDALYKVMLSPKA